MKTQIYIVLVLTIFGSFSSCVSYLPPSSLHVDMLPTRHAMVVDSGQSKSQLLDVQGYVQRGFYHHKRDPEIEHNRAQGFQLGYSFAERTHSVAFNSAFTFGEVEDNDRNTYRHSNIILRSSFAWDRYEGPWHFQLLKLQASASRGFGQYVDVLRTGAVKRDEYNRIFQAHDWYYSMGFGSSMAFNGPTGDRKSLFFGFARGTDFDKNGFRADLLNLNLEYRRPSGWAVQLGGMLDARLVPRTETVYLGLSYDLMEK